MISVTKINPPVEVVRKGHGNALTVKRSISVVKRNLLVLRVAQPLRVLNLRLLRKSSTFHAANRRPLSGFRHHRSPIVLFRALAIISSIFLKLIPTLQSIYARIQTSVYSVLSRNSHPSSSPSPSYTGSSILLHAKPHNIPKSLSPRSQSARASPIQFFLKFHRERITEAHYFRWYDYSKLSTKILFSLAENSDSLRFAMVGFSALIYSYKFHQGARQVGLFYYEKALQELRLSLNTSPMEIGECFTAVATALQLSSFDV